MSDNGWQDIETAPHDGTRILLGAKRVELAGASSVWRSSVGWWDANFEYLYDEILDDAPHRGAWTDGTVASWWYEALTELNPTHWQPLPSPPEPSP
jgi:hypothetical protein